MSQPHSMIMPRILERIQRENRKRRLAPCEQELTEQVQLLEQIEAEDPGHLWTAAGIIAQKNYWFFLRVVLDYRWMDPWLHGEEVCRFLDQLEEDNEDGLVLMPRGTGKTGSITSCRPAWYLARNPHLRVLLANAEEKKAAKMGRANANIITNNIFYQRCFPNVRKGDKWGEDGYFLDSVVAADNAMITYERLDPSLSTYGIRSNVTGSHINGAMILDDLISSEMARSKKEVQRAEYFFKEAINVIDPGTPLLVCATRWTYHDYCGKIEEGELRGRRGRLKVLKLGITRKNKATKKDEIIFPHQFWEDDQGNKHEVGFTWENLEDLKTQLKGLYAALYYNKPVLDEDCQFDLDRIKRFKHYSELNFELGPVSKVAVEVESQAKAFISTIQLMAKKENRRLPIETVTSGRTNKEERIRCAIQPLVSDMLFNMREDHYQRDDSLGEEMRNFPKGYDDCLDAHAYCINLCQNAPKSDIPFVNIAVDPAFTDQDYSDYTAIAVGCMYDGEYYALDTIRFQTNRAEHIVRMIFNTFDKFDRLALKKESPKKPRITGFSSTQARARRGRSSRRNGVYRDAHTFNVDLSAFKHAAEE